MGKREFREKLCGLGHTILSMVAQDFTGVLEIYASVKNF
jgi:hypothetical protein